MIARATLLQLIRHRKAATGRRPKAKKRVPRQIYPHALEREYAKQAVTLVQRVQAVVRRDILPKMTQWVAQAKRERGDALATIFDMWHRDASGKDVRDAMKKAREDAKKALTDDDVGNVAKTQGTRTAAFQKQQLGRQLTSGLGVDIITPDTKLPGRLEGWVHENTQLIQSVPNRLLDEVEYHVLDAVNRGVRSDELADDIQERFDVSDSRAELIARDQIGKLFGQLNEDRQTSLGISGYVWRTALDERVRPEHVDREGESFQWDDPPEDGHPGEPVQCRCYAEPDLQEVLDEFE